MTDKFKDRVVLISGAGCVGPGWGNGRAMAVRFAEEGAKIFAVDRDLASMDETVTRVRDAGGTIHTHIGDATDSKSLIVFSSAVCANFGAAA